MNVDNVIYPYIPLIIPLIITIWLLVWTFLKLWREKIEDEL